MVVAHLRVQGLIVFVTMLIFFDALAELPNLTRNDQYPIFSSVYPYDFLATRQKAALMRFDYTYTPNRFRISVSGYSQYANRARDCEGNMINIGDINGRWNMLGLFYDSALRTKLYTALGIGVTPTLCNNATSIPTECEQYIINPTLFDTRQEFGFYTIPTIYRKYGARFESELLILDRCYYAVGLRVQCGIADVRQSVTAFEDLTGQALGVAYLASPPGVSTGTSTTPLPQSPIAGITPPYIDPTMQPPCYSGSPDNTPDNISNCVTQLQPFTPCASQTVCLSFEGYCKQFVIQSIMNQTYTIAQALNLDINNYHKVGMDDLRLLLYWRHIYIINEDDETYPRVVFMPFAEAGVGIPMERHEPTYKPLAVPIGNNNHTYVGGTAGFTIDFLDTIDLTFAGGFSYFFPREICNYRLPTNVAESGLYPYSADVNIRPGPTWYFNVGFHAYHFLDNLSFWFEYCILSHAQNKIEVCRSFIPPGSCYFNTGFLVERAEALSKWEVQLANFGLNYDLSDYFSFGGFIQVPVKERNAYRQGTFMGTITFWF